MKCNGLALAKKKTVSRHDFPRRLSLVPATQGQVSAVRNELKSDVASVQLEIKAVRAEIVALRSEMEARFQRIEARFERMEASMQRLIAVVEEQNARNKVAFEAYAHMFEENEVVKKRLRKLEKKVFGIESV